MITQSSMGQINVFVPALVGDAELPTKCYCRSLPLHCWASSPGEADGIMQLLGVYRWPGDCVSATPRRVLELLLTYRAAGSFVVADAQR
jgi:hypothetical protein